MKKLIKLLDYIFDDKDFPYIIAVFNTKTEHFTKISKSCEEILGYRTDEIINRSYKEFLIWNNDEINGAKVLVDNINKDYRPTNFVISYKSKDNKEIKLSWYTTVPIGDEILCIARHLNKNYSYG